jgi:hypothetical protein
MSNSKKIVLPTTKWVELYARLSEYVLEYSSLDPIYNDDGTKTEEKQDEFCNIVDDVENILRMYFIKADEIKNNEEQECEDVLLVADKLIAELDEYEKKMLIMALTSSMLSDMSNQDVMKFITRC